MGLDARPGFFARAWFSEQDSAALVALAAQLGIPIVVTEEEPERNGATDPTGYGPTR